MQFWLNILSVAVATAAVIQRQETNSFVESTSALPGASVASGTASLSELPLPTVSANGTLSSTVLVAATTPTIQLAGLIASCTPQTICLDKMSPCGKRYGGSVLPLQKLKVVIWKTDV